MGKNTERVSLRNMANKTLNLGYVGENLHTRVYINCTEILRENPDAEVTLKAILPDSPEILEQDVTVDGDIVKWVLTQEQLAAHGSGQMQLTFAMGDMVIRSPIGRFTINASLQGGV